MRRAISYPFRCRQEEAAEPRDSPLFGKSKKIIFSPTKNVEIEEIVVLYHTAIHVSDDDEIVCREIVIGGEKHYTSRSSKNKSISDVDINPMASASILVFPIIDPLFQDYVIKSIKGVEGYVRFLEPDEQHYHIG
jgi:hypothetical protein